MFHEVILVGAIGREPELRYTADGRACCSFSVASNRNIGNGQKETTWFKVNTWEKTAENIASIAHKGMKVLVIGRLIADKETGNPRIFKKNDGTYASSFELSAREFRIVDFGTQDRMVGQTGQNTQPQFQTWQQSPVQQNQIAQQSANRVQNSQVGFVEDIPW